MLGELKKGDYRRFFSNLGFDEDPFAYTNADQEDRLQEYFIPPPYFASVFGNPIKPKSFIVFAPRGGGKSAQRRIIEEQCFQNNILSITIDQFEFSEIKKAREITLNHHLHRIIRNILIGIISTVQKDKSLIHNLSKHEQQIIVRLAKEYISNISEEQLKNGIDSLKSPKNKMQDIWNEWLPIFSLGINIFLKKVLDIDIDSFEKLTGTSLEKNHQLKYTLDLLVQITKIIGYKSVYILIDRVDESELTGNNSTNSFKLIEPLLLDLDLLEMNGIAFKFFLWDELEPAFRKIGRTDRIQTEVLEWDDEILTKMWIKRINAFSHNKVHSLQMLSDFSFSTTIDQLALIFANRSPRDMIRIGQQIISEQMDIQISSTKISEEAVEKGIEKFCSTRTGEIVTKKTLDDLRKIHQADFTIPFLSNSIFREKQTSTRNRIMRWRQEGVVFDVDRVDNPDSNKATTVKLFALQDARVAKVVFSDYSLTKFMNSKIKKCPKCGTTLIRNWDKYTSGSRCHECRYDLYSDNIVDDIPIWKRKITARESRSHFRSEKYEVLQKPLFDLDNEDLSKQT